MSLSDLIGLAGVAIFVVAHFAVQVLQRSPRSDLVIGLNLVGPVLMLVSLSQNFNLASVISQIVWFVLTLAGWWRRRHAAVTRPRADA